MDYNLETEMEEDYFHIRVEPTRGTELGDLAGRLEENGMPGPTSEINGYTAEAELTDDSIHISLDISGGYDDPKALVDATEEVHNYLDDGGLSQDIIDRYSGGVKDDLSHTYK